MAAPMTIMGSMSPTGSKRSAASTVKTNHASRPTARAGKGTACGAPRKKSALTTLSADCIKTVAYGEYLPSSQPPWKSMGTEVLSVASRQEREVHSKEDELKSHRISARIASDMQRSDSGVVLPDGVHCEKY